MDDTEDLKTIKRKLRRVRGARGVWDGFEDSTHFYLSLGRSYAHQQYWRYNAPRMGEYLTQLSADLNSIRPDATARITLFLGSGCGNAPDLRATFVYGTSCLIELESRYREMEAKAMKEERRRILSYLAEADREKPGEFVESDAIGEALGMDGRRAKTQLRLLRNDRCVQLIETIDGGVAAMINEEGYRLLEEGAQANVPAHFNINIVGGDNLGIQAAGDGQVVTQRQHADLAALGNLVESFSEAVNSSLGSDDDKRDATRAAVQLVMEARKAKPDQQVLKSRLNTMAVWAQALALGTSGLEIVDRVRQVVEGLSRAF